MTDGALEVVLAQPRGFCAGVTRAIDIVERALEHYGRPVYVFHEIVHNGHVVEDLRAKGAVFVEEIAAIPRGAVTIFSAHGVAASVEREAAARGLRVIDATCPLVAKVHDQVRRYTRRGGAIVMIGHAGHQEVTGTVGTVEGGRVYVVGSAEEVARLPEGEDAPIAYVTQTTLSTEDTRSVIDALVARYPRIAGPQLGDICYATTNRQAAVRRLAAEVDLVLVIGAANSSNTARLREVALQEGVRAFRIEHVGEIDASWLAGARSVGLTAGASTPESLVVAVREWLESRGATAVRTLAGPVETARFRLPALPVPIAAAG
ncbi:MAG: 4-hydroxy-3-methylbut-2-enyl diphosphate reductase [Proteobacteria bacterium]|nr:4-hydroxy-3-methylbut-2-enyl diphosphate reductase [Pseudomonadota bacterium]